MVESKRKKVIQYLRDEKVPLCPPFLAYMYETEDDPYGRKREYEEVIEIYSKTYYFAWWDLKNEIKKLFKK